MLDQLLAWLNPREMPPIDGITCWRLGIALSALCFRWTTWLAILLDNQKPIDPRTKDENTSLLSPAEFDRICIEGSRNLEQMLRFWYQNEIAFIELLWKAYYWLPMPCERSVYNTGPTNSVYASMRTTAFQQGLNPVEFASIEKLTRQNPFRILSNTLTEVMFRGSAAQSLVAGEKKAYSLDRRRIRPRREQAIFHEITANASGLMQQRPAWQYLQWPESVVGIYRSTALTPAWMSTESVPLIRIAQEDQ